MKIYCIAIPSNNETVAKFAKQEKGMSAAFRCLHFQFFHNSTSAESEIEMTEAKELLPLFQCRHGCRNNPQHTADLWQSHSP